jgi:hypothetical protein
MSNAPTGRPCSVLAAIAAVQFRKDLRYLSYLVEIKGIEYDHRCQHCGAVSVLPALTNCPPPESTMKPVHWVSAAWLVPAIGRIVITNEGPGSVLGGQMLAEFAGVTQMVET